MLIHILVLRQWRQSIENIEGQKAWAGAGQGAGVAHSRRDVPGCRTPGKFLVEITHVDSFTVRKMCSSTLDRNVSTTSLPYNKSM